MLFVDFLAFLCWIGTVYAFTVPIFYFITAKSWEDRIKHLKVLGLLIFIWYVVKFLEKGVLDNVMQYNTVPAVGRWSSLNSSNVLTNIEFHDPYPSFPSGHMLLGVSTGLCMLRYYNSMNTKLLMITSVCISAIIKVWMGMHSIYDIGISILLIVSVYYILVQLLSYFKTMRNSTNSSNNTNSSNTSRVDTCKEYILFIILSAVFLYSFFKVTDVILQLIP